MQKQRTDWAERHVEEFLSLPLISEFVFRSLQTLDGTQKEVADFLVTHDGVGILISQKCQEQPMSRDHDKTTRWACKHAKKAVSQLCGALRTATRRPIWCNHRRRGRVQFPDGLPKIDHGIVIIEVFEQIDLRPITAHLPLDFGGTPITYLSVNDFLNLVVELRTTPELLEYLNARRSFPCSDLRVIGDEKSLYEFYLLNDGSFHGCASRADARTSVTAESDRLRKVLRSKSESDRYSGLLEHVADQLATRNPAYAVGIPPAILDCFEPDAERMTYLKMQSVLANLRLRERAELGRAFQGTIDKLSMKQEGFGYMAAHLDSRPKWVFVFGSCKGLDRVVLLERMRRLALRAMAFYGKNRCLTAVDRDAASYEVGFARMDSPPTLIERQAGHHLFGRLRTIDTPLNFVSDLPR
jgi:hypothetical protein